MSRELHLQRPLAFIDLETTGLSIFKDRILEIGILKIMPDGRKHQFYAQVNPEAEISGGATRVHGIKKEDLDDKPPFRTVASRVLELLTDCDVAGFNLASFDLPLLQEEFRRIGIDFSLAGRCVVDVKRIYHMKESRDLTAAYRFYCGADHEKAHNAFEDALVCWRVLKAQIDRYAELPNTPEQIIEHCAKTKRGRFLDSGCWFEVRNGQPFFAHGKHTGRALKEIAEVEPDYLDWMLGADIPEDTALLAARALRKKL